MLLDAAAIRQTLHALSEPRLSIKHGMAQLAAADVHGKRDSSACHSCGTQPAAGLHRHLHQQHRHVLACSQVRRNVRRLPRSRIRRMRGPHASAEVDVHGRQRQIKSQDRQQRHITVLEAGEAERRHRR